MAGHQAIVPPVAAAYFGPTSMHPVITQTFLPGVGWRRHYRKRVSRSWVQKLAKEGVTDVALTVAGRTADFRVAELLRQKVSAR